MPELPEVETMVERLQKYVAMNVATVGPADENDHSDRYGNDEEFVPRQRLNGVFRRGKFIIFMLDDCAILVHNAMSGYWDEISDPWTFDYVEGKRKSGSTDVRALIELEDKNGRTHILQFHDARKFGSLRIVTPELLSEKLSGLGPEADHTTWMYEPSEIMTPVKFVEALSKSKQPIKDFLLDQKRIAGVGNIYAAEALWKAKINPHRLAKELVEEEQMALFISIRSVLRQAFERRLDYGGLNIYRKKECPNHPGVLVRVDEIKGRKTYWCRECQK